MPKLIGRIVKGRGIKAPAFARPSFLLRRLRGDKRKSLFAGAGVIAAAVTVVSFLTWLAPDSDRPIPLQVVDHVLPGVAQQIEEQAATLLEGSTESVQNTVRNVREGLVGTGLRAAQNATPGGSVAPSPATLPRPGTATPTSEEPSPSTVEPSLPTTTNGPPLTTSEPATSPATEELPPVTKEPPPVTKEPPPVTEEPPPVVPEEPPTTEEPPPAGETPPPANEDPPPVPGGVPPTTGGPTLPPTQEPSPATNPLPPTTTQPPPPIHNEPPSP